MISIRRRVIRRSPHDLPIIDSSQSYHNRCEQDQVESTPDAIANTTRHPHPRSLQPLIFPNTGGDVIEDDVAETTQRDGSSTHGEDEQISQLDVNLQLHFLLALLQQVHGVQKGNKDPEVHDRINPTHSQHDPNPYEEVKKRRAYSIN